MASNNVRFLKGTSTSFAAIPVKDENTFYYLIDTKELYLGENPIGGSAALEVIGSLENLKTTEKETLVGAINEIFDKLSVPGEDCKVTVEKDESGLSYKIRQGKPITEDPESNVVGIIDIPKDVIIKDTNVVENPDGLPAGKYIELVVKAEDSETGEKSIYLNINDLVKPYTAFENATKVQLFINEENVISATIVAGGVTATELASDAVETDKIKDGAVTKEKLAPDVLTAIDSFEWGTF